MNTIPQKRDDILVSICLSDVPTDTESCEKILRISRIVDHAYRYWEILLVVDEKSATRPEIRKLAAQIQNLRVIVVRAVSGYYRMRNVATSEAIGDVVVLTCLSDIEFVDLIKLIDLAAGGTEAIVCTRSPAVGWSPVLAALGVLSGYDINTSDMLTAAFPRDWLTRLLGGQDADLALRFPPVSDNFPIRRMPVSGTRKRRSDIRSTFRRIALLGDIMSNTAPRLLLGTAILSLFVTGVAMCYALYAVLIWALKANVQPGWLTTSLVQSLTAAFLGCALAAITMGIFKILDRLSDGVSYTIIDEYSNVDLFSDTQELNVEKLVTPPPSPNGTEQGTT